MHADFKLTLRRNAVEAAAAGVTLHAYDAESVACVLADTLECGESIVVDKWLQSLCFLAYRLFFLTCLGYYFLEFLFLLLKDVLVVGEFFLVVLDFGYLCLDSAVGIANVLFCKLYLTTF